MKRIEVEITGIAPLLQNRFPIESHGQIIFDMPNTPKMALDSIKEEIKKYPTIPNMTKPCLTSQHRT